METKCATIYWVCDNNGNKLEGSYSKEEAEKIQEKYSKYDIDTHIQKIEYEEIHS